MLDALTTPGIDDVDGAVTALNHRGIGILAHGRILKCEHTLPVKTVGRQCHIKRRARPFGCAGKRGKIVIDQCVATIGERHGICAGIIVGYIA